MICYYYDAPSYFLFASDLPPLLYYSHIPVSVFALIVGFFVLLNAPHRLANKLLFAITVSFSLWVFGSLLSWTNIESDFILFIWTFFPVLEAVISILCVYLIYVFLHKEDVSKYIKIIFLLLLAPVFLLAHTNLHLGGFNLAWCDAFEYEGIYFTAYKTALSVIAALWILVLLAKAYKSADSQFRKQMLFMGVGIEFFLLSFSGIVFLTTYFINIGLINESNSTFEFYSLFGMALFMTMMGILIVRFKSFNIGAHAAEALVVALLILVASQYTYIEHTTGAILTSVTLTLSAIVSIMLIRSVRKEIVQKQELEKLTEQLKKANKRLKVLDQMKSEFVSIASHQLRSPLTSIRGYASMLLEGSFGKLPEKAHDAITRISESSRYMAMSVEDYLNVSRIEAGRMKYELSDFNLKEMAEHVVDDLRPLAMKKGLVLSSKTSTLEGKGVVHSDIGKTQQIIHNLIDNAMKYTQKGSIVVQVRDNKKKKRVYVDVIDTGVGMDKETVNDVFQKFVRARNANMVNVTGTGLGLYVAKQMAEGMGGTITADSPGEGEGSVFTLEMPLQM